MIAFLAARAIAGVEVVTADRYARIVEVHGVLGTIAITHAEQSSLRATVRLPRLNVLSSIIARIRRLFDLGAEPMAISAALSSDPLLRRSWRHDPACAYRARGTVSRSPCAVLGQQITVTAATQLAGRLVAMLGQPLEDRARRRRPDTRLPAS